MIRQRKPYDSIRVECIRETSCVLVKAAHTQEISHQRKGRITVKESHATQVLLHT